MNLFTPSRFVENVTRLALGIEPVDGVLNGLIGHPVEVLFPETLRGLRRPAVARRDSCRHALLYQPGVADEVELRFSEPVVSFSERQTLYARRYVPRQITYPILTIEEADERSYRNRIRRPVLFPGSAYDTVSMATGMRGRVERGAGGPPVRWSRVEARIAGAIVGRGHGDDRGEFLLLLDSRATAGSELAPTVEIRVDVFARAADPAPVPPELPRFDPFWDLPPEEAGDLDPGNPEEDPVSAGEVLPPGFTATVGRNVVVPLGAIHSEIQPFTIA